MKKSISVIIRILVSFGLLGLLSWIMKDDFGKIWGTLRNVKTELIGIIMLLIVLNVSMQAYRLKIIFKGEDLDITLKNALRLTFIGYFFNNFMPTAVGGDIVKAHYASKVNGEKLKSYASVLMDRFIGLYTFIMIAAAALVVYRGDVDLPAIKPVVIGLMIAGLAGYFVVTHKNVAIFLENIFSKIKMLGLGKKLNDVYSIVQDYRNRKDVIAKSLVTSFLTQCVYFFIIFLIFTALRNPVSLGDIFLIMPIVIFISMIPSLGGLGVREGAVVAFFTPITGKDIAFAASLMMLAGLFFISLIGGIIYFWWNIRGVDKK